MNPTFRVSSGLIDPKHRKRIGAALWIFEWCIDKQTDADGLVLGGRSIRMSSLGRSVGISARTAGRCLVRLAGLGYLSLKRTATGYVIRVLNQKKWSTGHAQVSHSSSPSLPQIGRKRPIGSDENVRSDRTKVPLRSDENVRSHRITTPEVTTPEKRQGVVVTPTTTRDPAGSRPLENINRNSGGQPAAARPCSRCNGPGASGTPWLCAACHDTFRELNREAGLGVPEQIRRMAMKYAKGMPS